MVEISKQPQVSSEDLQIGEYVDPTVVNRRPVVSRSVNDLLAERQSLQPVEAMEDFVGAVDFKERYGHLKIVDDLVGLTRKVGDSVEGYFDKLKRAEKSGKNESARFGVCEIMGEKAVLCAVDWGYFAGSLGEVAGEKFVQAAKLAEHEQLPLVSFGASSGVRQHENVLGLVQMQRMAVAAGDFQRRTDLPYISVLAGQVWGGMSASAVPVADLVVALEGTDYGFAGRRVIETYTGKPVPPGAQSAEANAVDRNIDVLVGSNAELIELLGGALKVARHSRDRKGARIDDNKPDFVSQDERKIIFSEEGFYPALSKYQTGDQTVVGIPRKRKDIDTENDRERLMSRYREIISGANRLDSEFLLENIFDDVRPLYNANQVENTKNYPSIIAAIASIEDQGFMVIGDQPSYVKRGESFVTKKPANPGPEDFEYATRMIEMAGRLKLPIVFLTDTLGALPTLEAEKRGQSRAIANTIKAAGSHPYPTVSVITGALGSGGGLATTPFGRTTVMLDSALAFVSEPSSMASILYNKANPSEEEIADTLCSVRATAEDLREQGLVTDIVTDHDNPHQTAQDLRKVIVNGYNSQQKLTRRQLRRQAAKQLMPKMIG